MRLPKGPGKMLASTLLVAGVLGAAPDASHAQAVAESQTRARILERPSEAMAAAQMRRDRYPDFANSAYLEMITH